MNNNTSIIILAAGLGTRMKSKRPKVLFELCGEPMIIHILKQAYAITNDVSVVLHYEKELISKKIKEIFPQTKIFEQDLANFPGTAGAIKGVSLSGGKVEAIVEQKDASEAQLAIKSVNAGCYCFKREALEQILPLISNQNAQKEYYLTDAIKIANEKGLKCVAVNVNEQNFMGINDKFQLSIAEKIMQDEIKQNLMKAGVLMRMPESIFIDSRAKFEGECVLEENVSILGECVITESIIKSSSVIESSIIKNSDIGPLAHIRPNSEISDTHIGNFVEVKKGVLNGVKAGHLSYLGDCEIESGTNIGCGTITCNYDGKAKYKTKIGKNVFVGSDTQLVAPVNIADNVIIAAGSTITKDVESGALAISRGRQENKSGFFEKFFGKDDVKK